MIDPANVPDVTSDELQARYVVQSSQFRSSDQTVKQDAFIPPPSGNLSVTRHLLASEGEIWEIGKGVAVQRGKTLHGRADVVTSVCLVRRLSVRAAPIAGNPNHAHILDWPADKPAQKIIALEIAAAARFVPTPPMP